MTGRARYFSKWPWWPIMVKGIAMNMFLVACVCFYLGSSYGRWSAKHGEEWGYKAGRWTRVHIFGLPPVDNDRIER